VSWVACISLDIINSDYICSSGGYHEVMIVVVVIRGVVLEEVVIAPVVSLLIPTACSSIWLYFSHNIDQITAFLKSHTLGKLIIYFRLI